jgi:hypothetical protein
VSPKRGESACASGDDETNRVFNVGFTAETICLLHDVPTYREDLPVGTHPAHRRRGLAQAMMVQGLRLKSLGATTAYVGQVLLGRWDTA